MTYSVKCGRCFDGGVSAEKVLAIVERATLDHDSPIVVWDSNDRECQVTGDLDMERLVLRRGDEILAVGERVSEDVLNAWL